MELFPVEAGNFRLDGGAMFGVVPKTRRERTNPSDAQHRIEPHPTRKKARLIAKILFIFLKKVFKCKTLIQTNTLFCFF